MRRLAQAREAARRRQESMTAVAQAALTCISISQKDFFLDLVGAHWGLPGLMRSISMPSLSQQTESLERLNRALRLAEGTPLLPSVSLRQVCKRVQRTDDATWIIDPTAPAPTFPRFGGTGSILVAPTIQVRLESRRDLRLLACDVISNASAEITISTVWLLGEYRGANVLAVAADGSNVERARL